MSTETMSSRERLLAALRHEEVDRIPWSPCICGYFSLGLPEPLRGNDLEAQRAFGADIMERVSAGTYRQTLPTSVPAFGAGEMVPVDTSASSASVEVSETWKGNELHRVYETPVGTLSETFKKQASSPWLGFPLEHKVKTLADLQTYRYVVEAQQYRPTPERFIKMDREIGDEGLATVPSPISPFQALLEHTLGVEQVHYFLADYSLDFGQVKTAGRK